MVGLPKERRVEKQHDLAVTMCRAERVKEGRRWKREALQLGGNAIKQRALDDERLAVLWIGE